MRLTSSKQRKWRQQNMSFQLRSCSNIRDLSQAWAHTEQGHVCWQHLWVLPRMAWTAVRALATRKITGFIQFQHKLNILNLFDAVLGNAQKAIPFSLRRWVARLRMKMGNTVAKAAAEAVSIIRCSSSYWMGQQSWRRSDIKVDYSIYGLLVITTSSST